MKDLRTALVNAAGDLEIAANRLELFHRGYASLTRYHAKRAKESLPVRVKAWRVPNEDNACLRIQQTRASKQMGRAD